MKILIATDGSKSAETAIRILRQLPLPSRVRATLFTVAREIRPKGWDRGAAQPNEVNAELRKVRERVLGMAQKVLDHTEGLLAGLGWEMDRAVRSGHPGDAISSLAGAEPYDLVVMGDRGQNRFEEQLMGSVSKTVLRHAPCSVLIAREKQLGFGPTEDRPLHKVLLAYDGSKDAMAALDFLKELVSAAPDLFKVGILRVLRPYLPFPIEWDEAPFFDRITEEERTFAEKELKEAGRKMARPGLKSTSEFRTGEPTRQIVLSAREGGYDLIVMGGKGQSAIQRFLLGSVAHRVAHHAPCSVLVVRTPPHGPLNLSPA